MLADETNWEDWRNMLQGNPEEDAEWLKKATDRDYFIQSLSSTDQAVVVPFPDLSSITVIYDEEGIADYGVTGVGPDRDYQTIYG